MRLFRAAPQAASAPATPQIEPACTVAEARILQQQPVSLQTFLHGGLVCGLISICPRIKLATIAQVELAELARSLGNQTYWNPTKTRTIEQISRL